MPVMAVTLHRFATRFANCMFESSYRLLLRSGCSGHVEDFFFQNRAMQIVHAIAERHLCERQPEADPIRGEMIDVIQINPAHRQVAELFERGSALYLGEDPVGLCRFECERNETGEAACLIL